MNIENIRINNFRNIREIDLAPINGVNVIYGDNAQGKTNILEAMWLFSGMRSFRGARDKDLVNLGSNEMKIDLSFFAKERNQTASIHIYGDKKNVELNEIKQASQSKLSGEFCVVIFSPDHLLLVKQGPENRRAMIDSSLSQAYPKYAKIMESYKKILKQRASLLKDIQRNSSLYDLLDVWDKSLVEYGAYITWIREGYVKKLGTFAKDIYYGISNSKEELGIKYRPSFGEDTDGFNREDYAVCLEKAIKNSRNDDINFGSTSIGPHRDDMDILINSSSARGFGSQGQQRSCVLALKLAECGILEERNSEPPVILLDDVMSELDETRRSYLLNRLGGMQVVITCCDHSLFSALENGKIFHIENGCL